MTTTTVNFPFKGQGLFWSIFLIIFCGLLWLLRDVLAPFITGLAIAYMLNPFVTNLSRRLPRAACSLFVLLLFATVLCALIIVISPMIAHQAGDFFDNLPDYINHLESWLAPYIDQAKDYLSPEDVKKIQEAAGSSVGTALKSMRDVVLHVWSGGLAVIDVMMFMVITPVVAFYCMRDWPIITKRFDELLPRRSAKTLREMFHEFDMRLSGFVRGQVLVCICLGAFYGVFLTAAGLNFGLAIGVIAGILSFIPYVGSTFGFVSSVGVSLVQYDGFKMPLVIVAIFVLGQFIEGNFLTPNLVGKRIGLHAVWVIFALMVGGQLLGFTGMLLAVPVAALMGVIVRHGLVWYKQSDAYKK